MLTLALSSWSFHRHLPYFGDGSWSSNREGQELSILDFPRLATSFGIADVEICQPHLASTDRAYIADLRSAVEVAGCRVVNVPIDVGSLTESDPERRRGEIDRILPWIGAAYELGSPCVRVNTGETTTEDEAASLALVAEGYRHLAGYCAERGMSVLLENHGGLSSSPQAIIELVERVGAPNFRLCPDFGNFPPEVREEGLRRMLPYAAVVHAKVHDFDDAGRHPDFDLARCLDIVRASGYSGPLSIEFEGQGDEYEGVRKAREFLLHHLGQQEPIDRPARSRPWRIAIVGTGMIAHRHVARWQEAGAEVVAAADINPGALTDFSDAHGVSVRSTDYRALLEEYRDRFDIVDICTPPWLHAPAAFAALDAGKHVLCEKPFALSSDEGYAMADAADAAGKILACRQGDTRLTWQARTVRDVVRSGVLGDVYFMRLVSRALYRPGIEYNPEAKWFLERAKAGGGALYDVGVYDLELLFGIFGPLDLGVTSAFTFRGVDRPALETPYDVEEHGVATLRLPNGCGILWERAWATHLPPEHRWELYGTDAGLSFIPHSEVLRCDMDLRLTRYEPREPVELPVPLSASPGPDVYQDFLLACGGERSPACSGREAADMLRVIEGVYASAHAHVSPVQAPSGVV